MIPTSSASSTARAAASTTTTSETSSNNNLLFVDATDSNSNNNKGDRQQSVSQYYGTTLSTTADLQTNACCTAKAPPKYIQDALSRLADETKSKYYGCGLCLPQYDLNGASVLDLGCGAGRDVFLASQLVGEKGRVVGVDMTMEQLQAAEDYQDYHAEKFGFKNTEFYQGQLESLLEDVPQLQANSFDLIISNCVLNLCTDKAAVLKACHTLLRPGGEFYFSDVYASRRVPQSLQENEVLWNECLSGALYWNDFENLAKQAGFKDPRLVEDAPITVSNAALAAQIQTEGNGGLEFYSATYRLIKLEELEPACEDYGQAVVYKGTIPRAESFWSLDKHHVFETGRIVKVCGNSYNMLYKHGRLAPHFEYYGTWDRHYGLFEGCGGGLPFDKPTAGSAPAASCC
jgi:ubiquinone/menaquinone biosynthesis C-methylase UbiE